MDPKCDEKLSFNTEKEARATAQVAKMRYGQKFKVYKCTKCGLWHLTSNWD